MAAMRQALWRLVVDGQDIAPRAGHRLLSLTLTEKRGVDADELNVDLTDHDDRLALPPEGARIRLALGWRDAETGQIIDLIDKGGFKVDEILHQGALDHLSIIARSADLSGDFRRRRSQSWAQTTLGRVLQEVADRNDLALSVDPGMAARPLPHLAQDRESDTAFLARLGRRFDAVATVKSGVLLFGPPGRGRTPSGRALPAIRLTRRSGDNHSYSRAARDAYGGVIAQWRDRAGAETREVVVGSETGARRLGRLYASEDAARTAAQAEMDKLQRGAAEFTLNLAWGRPDIGPEQPITVAGFKPEIDGTDWIVTEATHALDGSGGLRTALKCERGAPVAGATNGSGAGGGQTGD